MLLQKFDSNNQTGLFALVVVVPTLLAFNIGMGTGLDEIAGMPFFHLLLAILPNYDWVPPLILVLLIVLCAVQVAALFNKLNFLDRHTQLPALFFVLMVCSSLAIQNLSPMLCGLPFVIWALGRSWSAKADHTGITPHFDAGLLIGLASMFYFPYLLLLLALWVSMAFMRTFNWREWLFLAVGVGVVYLFVLSGHYILGRQFNIQVLGQEWWFSFNVQEALWPAIVFWILSGVLFLWSLYWFVRIYGQSKMRRKHLMKALMGFSFFILLLFLFAAAKNERFLMVLLAIPAAFFFSYLFNGLYAKKRWLANGIFYVWLAVLLLSLWSERSP